MTVVYIGIGSNNDRLNNISAAINLLEAQFGLLTLSAVYESESVGLLSDAYYNLVVQLDTSLNLASLIQQLKEIEIVLGRTADRKKVCIDIDVLLYGDLIDNAQKIPRKDITENAFVLKPLSEIAPQLKHLILNENYETLWDNYPKEKQLLKQIKL